MNMVNLGYWIAALLIAMIVVMRGYPLVRQLRAEGKFNAGRLRRVAAQVGVPAGATAPDYAAAVE
jgi:hypothetical protein